MIALLALAPAACGGGDDDGGGGGGGGDGGPGDGDGGDVGPFFDAGPAGAGDDLDTDTGCAGIFNPDQMLQFELTMSSGDWSTVQNDCTFTVVKPAELSCGGESMQVGVRHKRSGGTERPGLKIDINYFTPGQTFHGLKKMDWENGAGSSPDGCGEDGGEGGLFSEYLGWRLHVMSGAITGRAAFIEVSVNGDDLGRYVNVEQIDKRFVRTFVGDDDGWIWKFSGSDDDGQKTNEGVDDPYDDYFCFFKKNGCDPPSSAELEAELPDKLDIPQLLTIGGVNALMANHDAIMLKLNNYIFYDRAGGGRIYLPWDLDSTMSDDYDVFTGTVAGGTTVFTDALFTHWEDDYDQILTDLLAGPLSIDAIHDEIDRAEEVSGLSSGDLAGWWTARHADVSDQVDAHQQ